jgi:hypothetical protein
MQCSAAMVSPQGRAAAARPENAGRLLDLPRRNNKNKFFLIFHQSPKASRLKLAGITANKLSGTEFGRAIPGYGIWRD